jgi:hypothetical protein
VINLGVVAEAAADSASVVAAVDQANQLLVTRLLVSGERAVQVEETDRMAPLWAQEPPGSPVLLAAGAGPAQMAEMKRSALVVMVAMAVQAAAQGQAAAQAASKAAETEVNLDPVAAIFFPNHLLLPQEMRVPVAPEERSRLAEDPFTYTAPSAQHQGAGPAFPRLRFRPIRLTLSARAARCPFLLPAALWSSLET